jgi:exodeoxyribonuclease VII small subunit
MAVKKQNFEESMTRLETIVKHLERGDAPLTDALGLFEEGAGLIKLCGDMLDGAEQKVVRLKKGADGEPAELPFEETP